jgi:diadenosine tetraphosphate (Ap4A) HIT family hydrolase
MQSSAVQPFSLHPQLAQDTVAIGDLPLSRLLVHKDANYPWLLLVPRGADLVEISDLDAHDRTQLMNEISDVAQALKDITRCDKLNIAAIGNMVSQLHVHIVARRTTDAAWPRPVWGAVPAIAYRDNDLQTLTNAIARQLGLDQGS